MGLLCIDSDAVVKEKSFDDFPTERKRKEKAKKIKRKLPEISALDTKDIKQKEIAKKIKSKPVQSSSRLELVLKR